MFSQSLRVLVRTCCLRSISTVSAASGKQLLETNYSLNRHTIGTFRFISDKINPLGEVDPEDIVKESVKKPARPKTPPAVKITLLDQNDNMSVTTVEEATKLAEGRKLRLVKIVDMDGRYKRPLYKLMTEAQYLEEEIKSKKEIQKDKSRKSQGIKGEKILIVSSRINESDKEMKLKNAKKWLEKKFEVRVTISAPNANQVEQEKMYSEFENYFQGIARFIQKRYKGNDLKFQLMPPKEALQENNEKKSKKNEAKIIEVEDELDNLDDIKQPVESENPSKSNSDPLQSVFSKV